MYNEKSHEIQISQTNIMSDYSNNKLNQKKKKKIENAVLVKFAKEILNGKYHFLYSDIMCQISTNLGKILC